KDVAVRAADTVLLTVSSQLGVDYNAALLETIARDIAPRSDGTRRTTSSRSASRTFEPHLFPLEHHGFEPERRFTASIQVAHRPDSHPRGSPPYAQHDARTTHVRQPREGCTRAGPSGRATDRRGVAPEALRQRRLRRSLLGFRRRGGLGAASGSRVR